MLGFRELGEDLVNWVFRIMDAALVHVLGNLAPKIGGVLLGEHRDAGPGITRLVAAMAEGAFTAVKPSAEVDVARGARDLHDPLNIKQPLVSADLRGAAVDDRSRDCRSL